MTLASSSTAVPLINRRNAADQIAAVLHEQILSGQVQSGAALKEADLAREFGVARNTVREALRLLTMEGLASHAVHHGVRVRTFTSDEVRDIYGERLILEGAVASVAGRLTPSQIDDLERGVRRGSEHRRRGDARAWMTSNVEFHQQLVQRLGNRRLDRTFSMLMREVRLVLVGLERQPDGSWDEGNQELVHALTVDDGGAAYLSVLNRYLNSSLTEVLGMMTKS